MMRKLPKKNKTEYDAADGDMIPPHSNEMEPPLSNSSGAQFRTHGHHALPLIPTHSLPYFNLTFLLSLCLREIWWATKLKILKALGGPKHHSSIALKASLLLVSTCRFLSIIILLLYIFKSNSLYQFFF